MSDSTKNIIGIECLTTGYIVTDEFLRSYKTDSKLVFSNAEKNELIQWLIKRLGLDQK